MISKLRSYAARFVRLAGRFVGDRFPNGTRLFSSVEAQIYFGYYDVSPFSADRTKMLAMSTKIGNVSPHDTQDLLDIGYYDLNDAQGSFIKLAQSRAWNWQQGCRLQWLPNSSNNILYNDFDGQRYVTRIFDVHNKKPMHACDVPAYAVSPDGIFALGLDFYRLHRYRRGYGYHHGQDQFDPSIAVYKISLNDGRAEPLLRMDDVRKQVEGANYNHDYINHLSYAPDGQSFMFFYIRVSGGKRVTHLMVSDIHGHDVRHIVSRYSPSHYAWRNDGKLLLTAQNRDTGRVEYILVDTGTSDFVCIDNDGLNVDGHPTFIHPYSFISDTYPSRLGYQVVFKDRIDRAERKEIASFYLPPAFFGEKRCDLHPRLSADGKFVCVDIIRSGRRAMAVIPLEDHVA